MTTPSPAARPTRRWLPFAIGCAALLAGGLVAALAAGGFLLLRSRAQTGTPSVEYILDASPRMTEGSAGETRLSQAQGVLAEIVRPADAKVTAGLRVFGTGAQTSLCQDSDLLVPLAPASQGVISDRLVALTAGAGADAALAEAMVAAIRDLAGTTGPHSLVVVTGGADSCNPEAGQLIAAEAKKAGIKLDLFVVGFQVSDEDAAAIKGVVDETSGGTFLTAADTDELRRTLAAIQAHVDAPGTTTVAEVAATVGAGPLPTAASATAFSGPTGSLELTVIGFAGQPAETNGRLVVEAFAPGRHDQPIASDVANPTGLRLPPGSYDIKISYFTSQYSNMSGGTSVQWLEGVAITAGQTVTRSLDLKLGEVNLTVLEAAGKPYVDTEFRFAFRVYSQGQRTGELAWVIVTSTVTLQLPPGTYDVVVDFPDTNLAQLEQPGQSFEVKAGQTEAVTIDLKLGRLQVEVDDAAGRPVDPVGIFVYADLAEQPDQEFSFSFNFNPANLPMRAGVAYTFRIGLGDGRSLALGAQQVGEGEVKLVKVSEADFK
ncbi:MAG: hypothetical protein ABI847_17040 [Anaerolineales bacterium]